MSDTSDLVEYGAGEPFPGVIGARSTDPRRRAPAPRRAPSGAPNAVVVLDVGFDGELVGAAEVPITPTNRFGPVGFSCGYAAFDSVDPDRHAAPFEFTGTIHGVVVDLSGAPLEHDEAELRRLLTQR